MNQGNFVRGRYSIYERVVDWLIGNSEYTFVAPTRVMVALLQLPSRAPAILGTFSPGKCSRAAAREVLNKLEAFSLFATADERLNAPSRPLPDLIEEILREPPYQALWATEGVGYYLGVTHLQQESRPTKILSRWDRHLPERTFLPLHTGLGLAFACEFLRRLNNQHGGVRENLFEFFELCRNNSREDLTKAAIESLGLITRILRPMLVPTIDRILFDEDSTILEGFWHGVGRGLYFTPSSILPCASVAWPALKRARTESRHETGRLNAQAGLAWAVTLVNIRDPEVLETFLSGRQESLSNDAVANGLSSAAAIWRAWSPDSDYLSRLCAHKTKPKTAAAWDRHVTSQCDSGKEWSKEYTKNARGLADLFRYRSSGTEGM